MGCWIFSANCVSESYSNIVIAPSYSNQKCAVSIYSWIYQHAKRNVCENVRIQSDVGVLSFLEMDETAAECVAGKIASAGFTYSIPSGIAFNIFICPLFWSHYTRSILLRHFHSMLF